nr:Toll/interleukin-1 receptor (TIR) domain-containing protein [Tanacetum cinerariifolium]
HDGKNILKAMMHRWKILVVLDDVDRIEQLEALAGGPDDWLKSGSRIIITTRDEKVLKAHRVKFIHDLNLLSSREAICLFNITCILKGQTKDDAIRILECSGFHARIGLKVLEQRSLITISPKYGEYDELVLGMHDHIEEMGKNIVRRLHSNEPNKHSRLWIKEEVEDILANDMGTEETRCLK